MNQVVLNNNIEQQAETSQDIVNTCAAINKDEGFIDESDCECDKRNFSDDGENRVPFQYCFSCAPFHPSNGRGPTLVGPQMTSTSPPVSQPQVLQEQEAKLIYDMDLKSTHNAASVVKRKRQISTEETEDAINSILPKKRRDSCEAENLDDSGFQEEEKVRTENYLLCFNFYLNEVIICWLVVQYLFVLQSFNATPYCRFSIQLFVIRMGQLTEWRLTKLPV